MYNNLISILIPVFNKENYLLDSMNSILNQNYKNFEILIYDDCSTDNSLQVLNSINDSRIKIYKGQINKGVRYARDFLLKLAKGDYISFFDADDICNKNKYTFSLNYLNTNTKIDLLASKVDYINENGSKILKLFTFESFKPKSIKSNLFFCNTITTSTVVFRRSLIPFINFLEYNYVIGEDYFIWIKLSEKFNLVNLTKKLTTYRITNNGMMANTVNKYEEAINYIHNYQFEKIGLNNRYDLIAIHNKFMFTNNITQIYLKKSLILYKILLSNSMNTYDHISFLEQIRINWLRKLIVYSKNNPIKSIYIYFKYFKYHNYKSILNIYKLIIFSMYYLFKKNNVFN